MKFRETLFWQPGALARTGISASSLALTFGVGYLHTLTGLGYEFHVLFILPVLLAAWFLGTRAGYGFALLAAVVWFIADRILEGEQVDPFPLLFNTGMRLAIFLGGAWLLGEMRRVLQRESRLAREDALTQLPNRREFHERGRRVFSQAQRQAAPFTAVLIDLDKFKQVNDELGHDAGDHLLATVAQVMRSHVRESDIPGRLGGDEFALLLPNLNASSAMSYVEKLRQRLLSAMREQSWPVTFSIGVASYDLTPHDFDNVLAQADALMYEAKNGGRDRVQQRTFSGGGIVSWPERLRSLIPSRDALLTSRWLRWCSVWLEHPKLWRWSRRGVALGVAIGVFFGLLIPLAQIPMTAAAAIVLRANLPAAAASTLISNPVTFGPLYYAAFRLGSWITGETSLPSDDPTTSAGAVSEMTIVQRIAALGEAVAGWSVRDGLLRWLPDLPVDRPDLALACRAALANPQGYWSRLELLLSARSAAARCGKMAKAASVPFGSLVTKVLRGGISAWGLLMPQSNLRSDMVVWRRNDGSQ